MSIIDKLKGTNSDPEELEKFIFYNFEEIYDFFLLTKHSAITKYRNDINSLLSLNRQTILGLNINSKTNLTFICLLLDVSERLELRPAFTYLYAHIIKTDFDIGNRLRAASYYLVNIKTSQDYLNNYEIIFKLLQDAYENEEDNSDKVLMTLINYYSQLIYDFGTFNPESIIILKDKIEKTINENPFSFVNHDLIKNLLKIDLTNNQKAFDAIQRNLDTYLRREITKPEEKKYFLFENETKYSELLKNFSISFDSIKQLSSEQYKEVANDSIFHSLDRGTKILTEETQLLAYIYSYGSMHYEKLYNALSVVEKKIFENKISIVDWACGQGMASIAFFDFLNQYEIKHSIIDTTLIEPSEIALKRASLHVMRFSDKSKIFTINKDLDSLEEDDFKSDASTTKIHFFSNVLDMDLFSIHKLQKNITSYFKGENYFICVSPYINAIKTERINGFVKHYSTHAKFKVLYEIENKKGEWKSGWTRIVRVFKITL